MVLAITAVLAFLATSVATSSADAMRVFDGSAFKKKPATFSGFHQSNPRKNELSKAKLLIGGPGAQPGEYGRIKWTKWTRKKAVGFGTGWHRGPIAYDHPRGANPWNGGRLKITLRAGKNGKQKNRFTRIAILQRTSWRTDEETGACDYFLSFGFKQAGHRAHPWMQIGIGGGWPLDRSPCDGVTVS